MELLALANVCRARVVGAIRLELPMAPRSDSLPGTRSLIRSHCVSDKTVRIKTASFQKTVLNHTYTHLGIPFIVHGP